MALLPEARRFLLQSLFVLTCCFPLTILAVDPAPLPSPEVAENWLHGFSDGVAHWRNKHDLFQYPRYKPLQIREIADNILLYQRENGGWPKDQDPARILNETELAQLKSDRRELNTTFDNRTTFTHLTYLAHAYRVTGNEQYAQASLRGIEFTLKAQYPHGGWPHSFPNQKSYYPHVTIVDDVMLGVLATVGEIGRGTEPFDGIPTDIRNRAAEASQRGLTCLLRLQYRRRGELTGWASQYDSKTLHPIQGRAYEFPSLIAMESAHILQFLMRIESPTPEIIASIEAGVKWLEASRIKGIRLQRIPAETVRYENHVSRDDVIVVHDPEAPDLWARFYDLETNRPVMGNRDGKKVSDFSEVDRERRTGYSWYGPYATDLLAHDYPAWKKRLGLP